MAYRNLDEFLTRLELAGDLIHLPLKPDSTDLPWITSVDSGKAHVFTDPNGIRVVQNLLGTHQRIEQALRVASLDLIAKRLDEFLEIGKPGALGVMISRAMTMFSAIRTTTNRRAPSEFQVLSFTDWHQVLATAFSALQLNSMQATLLTGGESPRMASVSLRLDENEIAGEFWPELAVGETVALVIGGDPAFMIAAQAPLPDFIHRSYFASWLREKPLDMMRLPGLDIEIPSSAECVIAATVTEQYSEDTLLKVLSVWTKPNAIYSQVLPAERSHLLNAFIEIMLPLIRKFLPGVQRILLRNGFGIIVITNASEYLTGRIVHQLSAVPFFEGVSYWLMIRDADDIEGAVQRLMPGDIAKLSKLVSGSVYLWVLLDASWQAERAQARLPDTEFEIEHLLGLVKNNWLQ